MRPFVPLSAVLGVLLFVVGTAWAYAARNGDRLVPSLLLALATVCVLAATTAYTLVERKPGRLTVPEKLRDVTAGGTRLPDPAWWAPVGAAGLLDMTAGAIAHPAFVVVGALLLGAALSGLAFTFRRGPGVLDRRTVQLARRIQAFGDAHAKDGDNKVEGQVLYVGRDCTRLDLVGADGHFGDLTAPSFESAKLAATMAGMTVFDATPPELATRWSSTDYEWSRMAGLQIGGPAPH